MRFWYVLDGEVEEYSGQEANWNNSLIVCADSVDEVYMKIMLYHQGILECRDILYDNKMMIVEII